MENKYTSGYSSSSKHKSVRRDYHNKDLKNPYFDKDKKNKFKTSLYIKIIFAVVFIYVMIYSDLFKIENYNVYGLEMISRYELNKVIDSKMDSMRFYLVPFNNNLFFSKKALTKEIQKKYALEKISIDRNWKDITINIQEKISHLLILNDDIYFFADRQGKIIRQVDTEVALAYLKQYPLLVLSFNDAPIGSVVVDEEIVDFIIELNKALLDSSINIVKYTIKSQDEINAYTDTGWIGFFDVNSDIEKTVNNLTMVLGQKIEDQTTIEYIDMRFGNKVFFK